MSQQTLLKVLVTLLCLSFAACSGTGKSRKAVYEEAVTLPPLDVPPDLTAPAVGGAMSVPELQSEASEARQGGGTSVLPHVQNVRLGRDGATRWLVVDASAEQLWPRLEQFWEEVGLEIAQNEPPLGILETQWAENRAEVPNNFLSRLLPKLYSSPKQDKFRMRLERGDGETTEIFLTHYGVEEVVVEQDDVRTVTRWQTRPSDVALVNEILQRLMVYIGVPEGQAQSALSVTEAQADRATVDSDGASLVVFEQFPRAWRRTGIALDRSGFVVEDRNRSQGIYFVKETNAAREGGQEKKGWLSGLFSDEEKAVRDTHYLVAVEEQGQSSRVTVRDENGTQLDTGKAKEILRRLYEELK